MLHGGCFILLLIDSLVSLAFVPSFMGTEGAPQCHPPQENPRNKALLRDY